MQNCFAVDNIFIIFADNKCRATAQRHRVYCIKDGVLPYLFQTDNEKYSIYLNKLNSQ